MAVSTLVRTEEAGLLTNDTFVSKTCIYQFANQKFLMLLLKAVRIIALITLLHTSHLPGTGASVDVEGNI